MKIVNLRKSGGLALGVVAGNGIIDASEAGGKVPGSLTALLASPAAGLAALRELAASGAGAVDPGDVTIGPAVGNPGKIICVGHNYLKHVAESNAPVPTTPVLFSKFGNTICADGDFVPLPGNAEQYDYEVELGVLIGTPTRYVSEADALDHVLGYVTANDISARDLQTRTPQFLLGKTLDKFLPNGPYLVTPDEVGDPQTLQLRTWVNGNLRQDSNTVDMIFNVRALISYISQYFPLDAGDFIITGTPSGVAMGMPDKPWLKPGDVVEVEVQNVGKLRNVMATE